MKLTDGERAAKGQIRVSRKNIVNQTGRSGGCLCGRGLSLLEVFAQFLEQEIGLGPSTTNTAVIVFPL